jgi:hypothetical protein
MQHPTSIGRDIHRFYSIVDQVKYNLLQLPTMTIDKWQLGRQLSVRRHRVIPQTS